MKYAIISCSIFIVLAFFGLSYIGDGFSYKLIRVRDIPLPGKELQAAIEHQLSEDNFNPKENSPEEIMDWSNSFVASRMKYVLDIGNIDPDMVWKSGRGNCASYAALQVSVLNYIFKSHLNMLEFIKAEWHYADVYYAGYPFIKPLNTHCYPVVVLDDKRYYPDACFKDLFFTGFVVSREEVPTK